MTSDPSDSHCAGNLFQVSAVDNDDDDEEEEISQSSSIGAVDGKVDSVVEDEADHILPLRYRLLLMIPYPPSVKRVSDAMMT